MYQYKFSDEDSQEITDKTNKITEIHNKFENIDQKYQFKDEVTSNKDSLNLQKKNFEKPTDEQIETQAKNSLSEYKQTSLDKIQNDYETNSQAIEQDLKDLSSTKQSQQESLKIAYNNAKTDAENDAIKRGLARSSIIVNTLAQYDNSMLAEFADIEKNYTENVTKLNNQKSQLEVQKQNALDNFDIAYAVKLSEKITDINNELEQKANEVIEYNNKIQQLEKDYLLEQEQMANSQNEKIRDDNQKLLEYYSKYGEGYIEKLKEQEKYDVLTAYLSTLSGTEVNNFVIENQDVLTHFKMPDMQVRLADYIRAARNKK